jgi:hypothetical protein
MSCIYARLSYVCARDENHDEWFGELGMMTGTERFSHEDAVRGGDGGNPGSGGASLLMDELRRRLGGWMGVDACDGLKGRFAAAACSSVET